MASEQYWNKYYGESGEFSAPLVPSQFAAFIASELTNKTTKIIDFGCGNGRDSAFFARHGFDVLSVDQSEAAINKCKKTATPKQHFICSSIGEADLAQKIKDAFVASGDDLTIYARFFIHAIDEPTQAKFLELCKELLEHSGRVALEFRTDKDQAQAKITPTHYRRFVNPAQFIHDAAIAGFKTKYFVEGFGFAKYANDDAHVARFILER